VAGEGRGRAERQTCRRGCHSAVITFATKEAAGALLWLAAVLGVSRREQWGAFAPVAARGGWGEEAERCEVVKEPQL